MSEIDISEEKWYNQRDNRTNRNNRISIDLYSKFSVGIIVGQEVKYSLQTQIMVFLATNILARWCRQVTIELPEAKSIIPKFHGIDFKELIISNMRDADPFGRFDINTIDTMKFNSLLVIGKDVGKIIEDHVWIDSDGWIAGVGFGEKGVNCETRNESHFLGSLFASCLGVSEIFKIAVGMSTQKRFSRWYTLYNFNSTDSDLSKLENPEIEEEVNFGKILQLGCGAVGSSLIYLLSLTEWKAEIDLVDFDSVKIPNCSSSLVFSAQDALNKEKKIRVCERVLEGSNINPNVFEGDYDEYIHSGIYLNNPSDIVLCLANEREIWSTIQNNYPPLVFHATTTSSWGTNFGRHIPQKEWCIMCRFQDNINHTFTSVCAEGEIEIEKEETSGIYIATLPFLSPASAVILLSEIVKLSLNACPKNESFVEFSFRGDPLGYFKSKHRKPHGCYVCKNQNLNHYPEAIVSTKYWNKF